MFHPFHLCPASTCLRAPPSGSIRKRLPTDQATTRLGVVVTAQVTVKGGAWAAVAATATGDGWRLGYRGRDGDDWRLARQGMAGDARAPPWSGTGGDSVAASSTRSGGWMSTTGMAGRGARWRSSDRTTDRYGDAWMGTGNCRSGAGSGRMRCPCWDSRQGKPPVTGRRPGDS